MRVALTVWKNRISPLFDAACMLLIADIEKGIIGEKRVEAIKCESPYLKVGILNDVGANILVCGGISAFYANLIEARGIKIIPFISGDINDVLDAYVTGNINQKKYRMPGCETVNVEVM